MFVLADGSMFSTYIPESKIFIFKLYFLYLLQNILNPQNFIGLHIGLLRKRLFAGMTSRITANCFEI
jgi:hypothetical protein